MATVETGIRGSIPVATLSGELTASQSDGVAEALNALINDRRANLAVDISKLEFIDSTGLGILMRLVNRARRNRGRVIVVGPSPFVRGVFAVTRLDKWFEISNTLEEAGAALARG